ncbi:hypothetical protein D623_10020137 [Myotis brandtii]|uniref:Uncharacterized protein n=1 Tax=Myotis brandtii TaxID=109478 RepID=S7PLG5_MYOBR|nr:hypothetical protein D623_10020137 [Myotis brandtii]
MRSGQDLWTVCKAHLGTGARMETLGTAPWQRTRALRPTSGGALQGQQRGPVEPRSGGSSVPCERLPEPVGSRGWGRAHPGCLAT